MREVADEAVWDRATPSGNYPSSAPPAQMTPGGQPMSQGMHSPSRTDSADNAYKSLDASNRGYLQRSDVQGLSGFNFDQADTNHDGRLTKDELERLGDDQVSNG